MYMHKDSNHFGDHCIFTFDFAIVGHAVYLYKCSGSYFFYRFKNFHYLIKNFTLFLT